MMKRTTIPLFGKILGWLLLNVAVLALALVLVLWSGFGISLDRLFFTEASGQVGSVGRLILSDVRLKPVGEWDDVLRRYEEAYGVSFALLDPRGDAMAGGSLSLPPAILERVRPENPRRRERRGEPGNVVSANGKYWLAQRLPPPPRKGPGPPLPGWLVVSSDSLSAGGLFLDLRPWLVGVGVAVVLSVLWWLPLVRGITRSIAAMEGAMERVAGGNFELEKSGESGSFGRATRRRDELGKLARALGDMSRRLESYVTGQRRFLGDVAHELSAPIGRSQLAVEILAGRVPEAERERVEDLREEVEEMSKLVSELLSFSRTAMSAGRPAVAPLNAGEVIERAVAREGAGATVQIVVPGDLVVIANVDLLSRALGNLLRNAVRYAGGAGPVTVSAESGEGWVTVRVEDEGPGVPEAVVGRLFDPFFRVDASRDRETGGVGLGLAIVKTAIEACGGTVRCWNRKPSGFAVEIRLEEGAQPG